MSHIIQICVESLENITNEPHNKICVESLKKSQLQMQTDTAKS